MQSRWNYMQAGAGAYHAILGLEEYLKKCGLEPPLMLGIAWPSPAAPSPASTACLRNSRPERRNTNSPRRHRDTEKPNYGFLCDSVNSVVGFDFPTSFLHWKP